MEGFEGGEVEVERATAMIHSVLDKVQECISKLRPVKRRVYGFNEKSIVNKLPQGSKASVLCEMFQMGLPVPPGMCHNDIIFSVSLFYSITLHIGFVIVTEGDIDEALFQECENAILNLERVTGRKFGIPANEIIPPTRSTLQPILLCVRSADEQINLFNLGMNENVMHDICESTGYINIWCHRLVLERSLPIV